MQAEVASVKRAIVTTLLPGVSTGTLQRSLCFAPAAYAIDGPTQVQRVTGGKAVVNCHGKAVQSKQMASHCGHA